MNKLPLMFFRLYFNWFIYLFFFFVPPSFCSLIWALIGRVFTSWWTYSWLEKTVMWLLQLRLHYKTDIFYLLIFMYFIIRYNNRETFTLKGWKWNFSGLNCRGLLVHSLILIHLFHYEPQVSRVWLLWLWSNPSNPNSRSDLSLSCYLFLSPAAANITS